MCALRKHLVNVNRSSSSKVNFQILVGLYKNIGRQLINKIIKKCGQSRFSSKPFNLFFRKAIKYKHFYSFMLIYF